MELEHYSRKRGVNMINLNAVKQIEDGLYKFVSGINVNGIPWCLEYFDTDKTCLMFKRSGYSNETEKYIGGGYRAELPFSIYVQASKKDTKARLDLSRILYAVDKAFQDEMSNEFANLELDDAKPQEIKMTTIPSDYSGEGVKLSTFSCSFILTYEKKGKWE